MKQVSFFCLFFFLSMSVVVTNSVFLNLSQSKKITKLQVQGAADTKIPL